METTFNYRVFRGAAPDAAAGPDPWAGLPTYAFGTGTKIIMVWAHDARLLISFAYDGITYGDDIDLYDAPQAEPMYLSAQSFRVRNQTAGSICNWQVKGSW